MDDPSYGTVPTEELPLIDVSEGVKARVIAGEAFNKKGPFATVQAVQMIDFELQKGSSGCVDITDGFDTAMLYVYEGSLTVNSEDVSAGQIVLFDADSAEQRGMELSTTEREAKAILFAGKKLRESIAWHGPIVMNTQQQIHDTIRELRSGTFPPVRVPWDYKRIETKPKE